MPAGSPTPRVLPTPVDDHVFDDGVGDAFDDLPAVEYDGSDAFEAPAALDGPHAFEAPDSLADALAAGVTVGATALAPRPRRFRRDDPEPEAGGADDAEPTTAERVARLQGRIRSMQATTLDTNALPTLPALEGVLPGGLREGATYSVQGSAALLMTMLAGPSAAGSWTAVVGVPDFGIEAAAGFGVDLERLVLVPDPGEHWFTVASAVADVVTVVVVRPCSRVTDTAVARLEARLRQRGAALVVLGDWPHSDATLRVSTSTWGGLGVGHGHLAARQVTVTATGRVGAGRARSARLWLPDAEQRVRPVEPGERELLALPPLTLPDDPFETPFEPTHPFEPRPLPAEERRRLAEERRRSAAPAASAVPERMAG